MHKLFVALLIIYTPLAFSVNSRNMSPESSRHHHANTYNEDREGEDDPGILQDAKKGNVGAQFAYGMIQYQKGNYNEAAKWYLKAANKNHQRARYELGKMYVSGKGVPVNFLRAYFLFTISEEQGYTDSSKAKRSLERAMTPQQIKQARHMVRKFYMGEPVN